MTSLQRYIIDTMSVEPKIDPWLEISDRVAFLQDVLDNTGKKGFVLGISGGQDSALAGKLCQMAVDNMSTDGEEYKFVALRLPYGYQADENDAQEVIDWINPNRTIMVNIQNPVDASLGNLLSAVPDLWVDDSKFHFIAGNTKARERMKVHYDIAATMDLLVVGADNAVELATGFFTKYGDGGADVHPLFGLNKRQGKELLEYLGAPKFLQTKVPTADLRNDVPMQPDEVEFGFTYDQIDDYLEGKKIDPEVARKIEERFLATRHKRKQPVNQYDDWFYYNTIEKWNQVNGMG